MFSTCHASGGGLDWAWWNYSFATTIARLTHLDFSVWEYVKDKVFVPPLTASLEQLQARITEAVATIDEDMIHMISDEIAYSWDICRVTRGNHIEHL
jgi:hypothetical protein